MKTQWTSKEKHRTAAMIQTRLCVDQLVRPGYTRAYSSSVGYGGYPNKTIDGVLIQSNYTYCMHTAPGHKEAWLRINLRKIYNVNSVKFWYRNDLKGINTKRIQGFTIRLSNTTQSEQQNICYQDDHNKTLPPVIEKECNGAAKYIWIYTNKVLEDGAILEICEVQVYGCSYQDNYGNCVFCDHCKNDCNIYGECDEQGCKKDGYRTPYCKVCKKGFYGKNCNFPCGHCAEETTCDNVTGSCPHGDCEPGWKISLDKRCDQECVKGFYGKNCSVPCGHCAENATCDHVSGSCPSGCCEPGWKHTNDKRCDQVQTEEAPTWQYRFYGTFGAAFVSVTANVVLVAYIYMKWKRTETRVQKMKIEISNPVESEALHIYENCEKNAHSEYQELGELRDPSHYDSILQPSNGRQDSGSGN